MCAKLRGGNWARPIKTELGKLGLLGKLSVFDTILLVLRKHQLYGRIVSIFFILKLALHSYRDTYNFECAFYNYRQAVSSE